MQPESVVDGGKNTDDGGIEQRPRERCGGELYQRKDDNPETVESRLKVYTEQTAPLIDYYTEKGKILNFTGTEAPAEVLFEEVKAVLDKLKR